MKELPNLDAYRPNVGICLLNKAGDVWLGQRPAPKGGKPLTHQWQMPQGGMDPGETPAQTAVRELAEETGVTSVRLLTMTPGWLVYDFPEEYRMRKKEKWLGQRQKWALMLFDGEDSEIDLEAYDEPEFVTWRWAALEDMPELVVPFKRGVYTALKESFLPLAEYIAKRA
ncbi:MAG: RNA pyrophosphohydrolase [Pseudomonadota bacterium]